MEQRPQPNPQVTIPDTGGTFLPRALIYSRAFHDLTRKKKGIAIEVLLLFLLRRRYPKGAKPSSKPSITYQVLNNGELTVSYKEMERKHGIGPSSYRNAVDDLIEHGFLEIRATTTMVTGNAPEDLRTRYALSDNWRRWGKENFTRKGRPKQRVITGRRWEKGASGRDQ